MSNLQPGPEMDAEVARRVFDLHPAGIGYYGPPRDLNAPWDHDLSVRYDTPDEAIEAYRRYVAARVAAGEDQRGRIHPDHFHPNLCYWRPSWGPAMLDQYSQDDYLAMSIVPEMRTHSFHYFDLECYRTADGKYHWIALFARSHAATDSETGRLDPIAAEADTIAAAICEAALEALEPAP